MTETSSLEVAQGLHPLLEARAFRDIYAGTQHAMVDPQHHVEWARSLMPPAEPSSQ